MPQAPSSSMNYRTLSAEEIIAKNLILNGHKFNSVYTGEDKEGCVYDPFALITRGALDLALQEIDRYMKLLDGNGTSLNDLALISMSLCNPYFDNPKDWVLDKWNIYKNTAYTESNDGSLTLAPGKFTKIGKYLVCVQIDSLPSGKIELFLNDTWISTLTQAGVYYREFSVKDTVNDVFSIKVKDLLKGDRVVLYSLSVHQIADRLYNFLIEKIKSLVSIDADGFVSNEKFVHTLDEFTEQFKKITTQYLKKMEEHEAKANPHNLTAKDIDAAPTNHTHDEYITEGSLVEQVKNLMGGYAPNDHSHAEYFTKEMAKTIILAGIEEHINSLISVNPLIVTRGHTGLLPSRFAHTDISLPTTILMPTTVNHSGKHPFDARYGVITTNIKGLINEAPKVFSLNMEQFAEIPALPRQLPINFCISYHTHRNISGYRLRVRGAYLKKWSIYTDSTYCVHHVSLEEEWKRYDADLFVHEVYLDKVEESPMFSILIEDAQILSDVWGLKVELLYEDFDTDTAFGITADEFQFCLPFQGTNRLVTMHHRLHPEVIEPKVCMENVPVYVFASKELNDDLASFGYSYIPPEYSSIRKGINVFVDKFKNISREGDLVETYRHPCFGSLEITHGHSSVKTPLTNIYDGEMPGWKSDGTTRKVTITQSFDSDHILLMGYFLSWNKNDESYIPDMWNLTLEGITEDNKRVTVVLDSVEQYYPFYSVEDDNIVYHKSFDKNIHVKKITLTMETRREDNPFIALHQLELYISERFYSIPQNTMFCGLKPVAQMCLGKASFKDHIGWETDNVPVGTYCVLPINDLKITDADTVYEVDNPFHTTDVMAAVQNYSLAATAGLGKPDAYISKITPEKITVVCLNPYKYAVSISRNW